MITIIHFNYFLLPAPPPKCLGDNGTKGRRVGRVEGISDNEGGGKKGEFGVAKLPLEGQI